MQQITSTKGLTLIALLFHIIGLAGIGILHAGMVTQATPFHLLLMFILLSIAHGSNWKSFFLWMPIVFILSFGAEWVGVHTGWLFGHYSYTTVLGWKWQAVPVIIGCNWVIVTCGAISLTRLVSENIILNSMLAATAATVYDWVLEPAAHQQNYWVWAGGHIPHLNYVCWWVVSFVISLLWQIMKNEYNQFAVNLFLIQILFFSFLRLI
jgi:bisanhydrobacterioruberin hydratase